MIKAISAWIAAAATSPGARKQYMLAAKAALATGLAWVIAHFVPGPAADYAYYAPLGALVSLYSTVFGSAKKSLQTLFGLAVGIALGLAAFVFGTPNVFTIGLAVGVGVLLGGLKFLGPGSTWVATATLFVLVVGGNDAEDYSYGYLIQMLLGIAVGIAVNLLVFPPLYFGEAEQEMLRMKIALADQLADISAALTEEWPPKQDSWAMRSQSLSDRADRVRAAVQEAHESRRGNPRRLLPKHDTRERYDELRILEGINFSVQEITEVLSGVAWSKASITEIAPELVEPLAACVNEVEKLLREWQTTATSDSLTLKTQLQVANDALTALMKQMDDAHAHPNEPRRSGRSRSGRSRSGRTSVVASVTVTLSRIIDYLRPTVETEGDGESDENG